MMPMKDFGQVPAGKVPTGKVQVKAKQSVQCVLCEYIMTELDHLLVTNRTEVTTTYCLIITILSLIGVPHLIVI